MSRIVAAIRWRPPADPDVTDQERDRAWVEIAGPLFERAAALGGRVVGFADRYLAVDFAFDGLYDAVDFIVDAPLLPELASGLCHGRAEYVFEGPRVALGSGTPLRVAEELTLLARPGEVVVTDALARAAGGMLGTLGPVGLRPGRPALEALILDPDHPIEERASLFGSEAPPPSGGPLDLDRVTPRLGEAVLEFAGEEAPSLYSAALADRHLSRLVASATALEREPNSMFPEGVSDALRDSVDGEGMDAAPRSLKELAAAASDGPSSDVAERLGAMAELVSGRSGEAIRRLRVAKEKVRGESPALRSRAALALGLALLAAGRPNEAILEALEALARAREGADGRGERACARFLAQLSATVGDRGSESTWSALSS